ncbi:hypothetical protein B7463_g6540, partial [Scytalidium lignicola]
MPSDSASESTSTSTSDEQSPKTVRYRQDTSPGPVQRLRREEADGQSPRSEAESFSSDRTPSDLIRFSPVQVLRSWFSPFYGSPANEPPSPSEVSSDGEPPNEFLSEPQWGLSDPDSPPGEFLRDSSRNPSSPLSDGPPDDFLRESPENQREPPYDSPANEFWGESPQSLANSSPGFHPLRGRRVRSVDWGSESTHSLRPPTPQPLWPPRTPSPIHYSPVPFRRSLSSTSSPGMDLGVPIIFGPPLPRPEITEWVPPSVQSSLFIDRSEDSDHDHGEPYASGGRSPGPPSPIQDPKPGDDDGNDSNDDGDGDDFDFEAPAGRERLGSEVENMMAEYKVDRRHRMQDAARPALKATIRNVLKETKEEDFPDSLIFPAPSVKIIEKDNTNKGIAGPNPKVPQSIPPVPNFLENLNDPDWVKENGMAPIYVPVKRREAYTAYDGATDTPKNDEGLTFQLSDPESDDADDLGPKKRAEAQDLRKRNKATLKGKYEQLPEIELEFGELLTEIERLSKPDKSSGWDSLKAELHGKAQNYSKSLRDYTKENQKQIDQLVSLITARDAALKASDVKMAKMGQIFEEMRYKIGRNAESLKARDETIKSNEVQIRKLQQQVTDLRATVKSAGNRRSTWFGGKSQSAIDEDQMKKLAAEIRDMQTQLSNKERKIQDLRDKPCHSCELLHKEIADLEERQAQLKECVARSRRDVVELQIIRCRMAIEQKKGPQAVDAAEEAIAASKHRTLKNDKLLLARCHFWAALGHFYSGKRHYALPQIIKAKQLGCGSEKDESEEGTWMSTWLNYFNNTAKIKAQARLK